MRLLIGDLGETMRKLAPNGWKASPLFAFFHPTLEQAYEGHLRSYHRMNALSQGRFEADPIPSLATFASNDDWKSELPLRPEAELLEILGMVIYELEVYRVAHPSGCLIRFETGRYWGDFIAQLLNMHYPLDERDFVIYDFFNATVLEDYVDLSPVWQLFFRRMKAAGYSLLSPSYRQYKAELPLMLHEYRAVYGSLPAEIASRQQ